MKKTFPPAPQQTSGGHELDPMIANTGQKPIASTHGDSALFDPAETSAFKTDIINEPPHYTHGAVESIELIESLGYGEGYCYGSALKYLYRAKYKDDEAENLRKARWFIERRLKQLGA